MKITFSNNLDLSQDTKLVFIATEDFIKKNVKLNNSNCGHKYNKLNFNGKLDESLAIVSPLVNDMIFFYGIGTEWSLNDESYFNLEKVGYGLYKFLKKYNAKKFVVILNGNINSNNELDYQDKAEWLKCIATGLQLSDYSFDKYKIKKTEHIIDEITFLTDNEKIEEEFEQAELETKNVFFCRDLVAEPSNILNPESYAELCKGLENTGLEVTVFDENVLAKLGMNALVSVGRGSNYHSKLVVLKWKGLEKFENPLAFVGKGITFDSGGISIKPSSGMEEMKGDMAGSAVVVSLMKLLAERKAKVNAVGIVPLVENMPSGTAYKPGDIIKTMSGQTVEVLSTDAEGRMILADALYYTAINYEPEIMIDLATLTGAMCVALGEGYAGLFSNSEFLTRELQKSSLRALEYLWRMPLSEIGGYYDKLIDSDVADMKNTGGRDGGSITAAQFLQRFIDKTKKWAHIDIAATSFVKKSNYFVDKGETGFGVRLLNRFIKSYYEK